MLLSDIRTLEDWGRNLRILFNNEMPYIVGSCLERKDYRDVDVRMIMEDTAYERLANRMNVPRLNHVVSMWGQRATGLPIDFQVQQRTAANEKYPGVGRRHPLGMSDWDDQSRAIERT
jgi:hypothetical protein